MAKARFETFDKLLALTGADLQPVALALRDVVLEAHRDAVEVVRWAIAPPPTGRPREDERGVLLHPSLRQVGQSRVLSRR